MCGFSVGFNRLSLLDRELIPCRSVGLSGCRAFGLRSILGYGLVGMCDRAFPNISQI
ncbi:hypothetical protein ACE1CD_32130 [Aerosakkonema sp. BLCC-F183]|uniref:hypothetical protein n=1 Tax=Aerosakkonema sp. BLCC-F183 TaxID=3342834 RepID=UPI0035BB3FFE